MVPTYKVTISLTVEVELRTGARLQYLKDNLEKQWYNEIVEPVGKVAEHYLHSSATVKHVDYSLAIE